MLIPVLILQVEELFYWSLRLLFVKVSQVQKVTHDNPRELGPGGDISSIPSSLWSLFWKLADMQILQNFLLALINKE